jgi:hypothetical protein
MEPIFCLPWYVTWGLVSVVFKFFHLGFQFSAEPSRAGWGGWDSSRAADFSAQPWILEWEREGGGDIKKCQ